MKISFPFLLFWLLLLPLPSKVHATKSVDFNVRAARHNLNPGSIYGSTPQDEKKAYKQPSGPNPVGNHRPPSRT
ncbi:hypothetical protein L2E82_00765 [Cichorium intybus]|uniref:Uncharacterized protein n=1 Tax=Cichorium intybus TaxID=13427 RepID=A0ACB9GYF4_CICIN|nr:hypothetical protein L2E82_00765 [Cichorium intybus]